MFFKKMLAALWAAVFASIVCVSAFAAEATLSSGKAVINHDGSGAVIWSAYDSDGKLVSSEYLTKQDGVYYGGFIAENGIRYRLCDLESGVFSDVEVKAAEPTVPSAAPVATVEPTVTPAATATPFPAAYERSLDATHAFSVVKSVETIIDDDNEKAYRVEALKCGEEIEYIVPEDAKIVIASDYYDWITDASASALEAGDIVYFEKDSGGEILRMAFIYRAAEENIITSDNDYGENFERLISAEGRVYPTISREVGTVISYGAKPSRGRYQYAFGAVTEVGGKYFTLFNRTGLASKAIEVSMSADTIVYVCDMSGARPSISTGAVIPSAISIEEYDDDGNIRFTDEDSINYAFARIINGTASEVVLYTGYGE